MKRLHFHFGWVIIVWSVFLLVACASTPTPTPQPTQTPTAMHTPAPTLTPAPILTATPTFTLLPTLTPLPTSTPTATPDLLKDATAKSEARVLELAKKQGLGDVKVLSFSKLVAWPQYQVVSILQSTTDKTRYWIPSADSAALVEARVPQDAKEVSWDFKTDQPTYTSAYGTMFWLDADSGLWLSSAGSLKTYKPGEEQKAVADWLNSLIIINQSSTKTFAKDGTPYGSAATNSKAPLLFKGGANIDPATMIKEALAKHAIHYTDKYTPTLDFAGALPTLENNVSGLQALINIKQIVLTDDAGLVVNFAGDGYSNVISAHFDPKAGTLYINIKTLYAFSRYYKDDSMPYPQADITERVMVQNLATEAIIGLAQSTTDIHLKRDCPISIGDLFRPAAVDFIEGHYLIRILGETTLSKDWLKGIQTQDDVAAVNAYRVRKTIVPSCR